MARFFRVQKAGSSSVQTFRPDATIVLGLVLGNRIGWSKVQVTCRTTYHAVIMFFGHILRYDKLFFFALALKYAYSMLFYWISIERANLYLAFLSFCSSCFLTHRFLKKKTGFGKADYGNKCWMRNLVKIGSGMPDPDPDVFISNERLRLQATVLRVLDILGCLFLQIYLC